MNKNERALRKGKEVIKNYRNEMLLVLFGSNIDNVYNENYFEFIKMSVQKYMDAKIVWDFSSVINLEFTNRSSRR